MSIEFDEIKSHIRDINLDFLVNSNNSTIDVSRRFNTKFRLFYPSRKLINCIIKHGGILTGSRAIRCFLLDGKPLLDRKVEDWDFLITLPMAYSIINEMGYNDIPHLGETISIKNQRMWRHPDYDEAYRVGIVDVQMIIVDELPDFIYKEGIKLTSLGYSLSKKIEITNKLRHATGSSETSRQFNKHLRDLKDIIIKFNCLRLLK
jgi:hypothetical protein